MGTGMKADESCCTPPHINRRKRDKLNYMRQPVACVPCRQRKIRCKLQDGDRRMRCENCSKRGKECVFRSVDQQITAAHGTHSSEVSAASVTSTQNPHNPPEPTAMRPVEDVDYCGQGFPPGPFIMTAACPILPYESENVLLDQKVLPPAIWTPNLSGWEAEKLHGFATDNMDENTGFVDSASVLPYLEPYPRKHKSVQGPMYPTALWSSSKSSPGILTWHTPAQLESHPHGPPSSQQVSIASSPFRKAFHPRATEHQRLGITANMTRDFVSSSELGESEATRRARYAANQRHSRAQQRRQDSHQFEDIRGDEDRAGERKQHHREINRVAAAKHRLRQRKQSQKLQEEGNRLSIENKELKFLVQELRAELTGLRWGALNHQRCRCKAARYESGWDSGNIVDGWQALYA